jgi:endonuclease/exonuclease/phosphatase family metal-dependent hydrolase
MGTRLRVASFNTHFGVTRRSEPFDIVGAIADIDADVIGLQEVWEPFGGTSFAVRAAEQLGYHRFETAVSPGRVSRKPSAISDSEAAEGWWGIALLSRYPGIRLPDVELGRIPTDPARRIALLVELDVEGTPVLVAVTHISHRLFGSPRQMRRLWSAVPRHGQPTVIMGDFNMWGPVVSLLVPGWRRPVRGRTWPAHRPHSQLDHILVNDDVTPLGGEVLDAYGSDHRPVRATIDV